jgi:ABC-type nitrate/sulfonate/bicarbonate transport system substrate-binding protein
MNRSRIFVTNGTPHALHGGVNHSTSIPALSSEPAPNKVRIGFIALADCAPLLVADELGLFAKHGVEVELSREVGWATIREKILYGQLDAAHSIAGLALSLRLGLEGAVAPAICPFVFNLHGDAITLSMNLWHRGVRDATTLHKLIRSTPQSLFTFAIVARTSSHNFLIRRWLKSGGIDPDRDVRLVVLPPTQMAGSLNAGLIDGYCVGEPWNSLSIAHGTGWCPAISEDIMPGHPEKVLLTTEHFANRRPEALNAMIRALHEACEFCDRPENRHRIIEVLTGGGHLRVDPDILRLSLIGPFDDGTKQLRDASNFHIFHRRDANVPNLEKAGWLLGEFVRHGLIPAELKEVAAQASAACWRTDIYHRALKNTSSKKTQNARAKTRATPNAIRKPRRTLAAAPAPASA